MVAILLRGQDLSGGIAAIALKSRAKNCLAKAFAKKESSRLLSLLNGLVGFVATHHPAVSSPLVR